MLQSSSSSVDIVSVCGALFTLMHTERKIGIYGKTHNTQSWKTTTVHIFLLIDSIESLEQLFKYTYNTWCDSSMNLNVVPFFFHPCCSHSCFPPSGMFPVVASLSTYVRSGIECWSNSGFHTPLITSISVGGLIIMDSKIFQSPLKNHIPWWRRFFFRFFFF